jgi:hypothetical protein
MFGREPYAREERCACGRAAAEATVTTYRSISGTYMFHRCPCGTAWTDHRADPEQPGPTTGSHLREAHEHFQAFHGAVRTRPTRARR